VAIISGFKWHLNLSLVGATGPKTFRLVEFDLTQWLFDNNTIVDSQYMPAILGIIGSIARCHFTK